MSILQRHSRLADRFDKQLGHAPGRGVFHRALRANQNKQRRIVAAFNAEHGTVFETIGQILDWLVENQDQIFAVVALILKIIGMFA